MGGIQTTGCNISFIYQIHLSWKEGRRAGANSTWHWVRAAETEVGCQSHMKTIRLALDSSINLMCIFLGHGRRWTCKLHTERSGEWGWKPLQHCGATISTVYLKPIQLAEVMRVVMCDCWGHKLTLIAVYCLLVITTGTLLYADIQMTWLLCSFTTVD